MPQIKDNSVTLLLTDPPYKKSAIPLYKALSEVAGRVLREGGSILCMMGSAHLPDVMQALCADIRLTYHWIITYHTPTAAPMLEQRRVSPFVKCFLWLVKGKYTGDWQSDYLRAPLNKNQDKIFHKWGQNVEIQKLLINKFTYPRELVLDCCCGGDSSAVAAAQLGNRRYIGTDIDPTCVRITKQRVTAELRKIHG